MSASNPLIILMVTNNYTPYSGGVVSSIDVSVNALQNLGHNPYIISLDFLKKGHNDPAHVFRVPCPVKFMYKKNYMAIPWKATKYIYKIAQQLKPSIIHSHHPSMLGMSAAQVARKMNIPIVFTYHTIYEEYAHYMPLPRSFTQRVIKKELTHISNTWMALLFPVNRSNICFLGALETNQLL